MGSDQKFVERLFQQMQGAGEIMENSVISMDLIKREKGIPYPMAILHCNLEHLAFNTKLITKELFKEINME